MYCIVLQCIGLYCIVCGTQYLLLFRYGIVCGTQYCLLCMTCTRLYCILFYRILLYCFVMYCNVLDCIESSAEHTIASYLGIVLSAERTIAFYLGIVLSAERSIVYIPEVQREPHRVVMGAKKGPHGRPEGSNGSAEGPNGVPRVHMGVPSDPNRNPECPSASPQGSKLEPPRVHQTEKIQKEQIRLRMFNNENSSKLTYCVQFKKEKSHPRTTT